MSEHVPVLLRQCIEGLSIREDGIYIDGTLGRGGHSSEILKRIPKGHLYCFDIDRQALESSDERLRAIADNYTLIRNNFSNMKEEMASAGVDKVNGILLDIGVSSPQFDDAERGFSYRYDARLDMRMDQSQQLDAYSIVNQYSYQDLVRIIWKYGEEPYARNIARKIEASRASAPIETTGQLVEIIKSALPAKALKKQGHPAKQTFQALRIETNHELDSLSKALDDGLSLLAPKGRMAVISFHSLEDEIVKEKFRKAASAPQYDKRIPLKAAEIPQAEYELVTRKPLTADEEELQLNHRSKSAKL
ncbi:MAG: 16S rRNA (cytosine(1402)-N(4))-methyltransferase RsmH, partial [Erysipelotrichaceae bacterium]|nr:16S rRNA (cytosine(1402)-N(4))-methyltransferase RsmH [Erysipelotrichaceae bacterium]